MRRRPEFSRFRSLEFFGWRAATCSSNRRVNEINPDPAAVVLRQIEGLMARTAQFSDRVQGR
jgi:hypothetical protein